MYSRQKRIYRLMYIISSTAERLIFAIHGVIEGKRHELISSWQSGWEADILELLETVGVQNYVHAKGSFTICLYIQVPFGALKANL